MNNEHIETIILEPLDSNARFYVLNNVIECEDRLQTSIARIMYQEEKNNDNRNK